MMICKFLFLGYSTKLSVTLSCFVLELLVDSAWTFIILLCIGYVWIILQLRGPWKNFFDRMTLGAALINTAVFNFLLLNDIITPFRDQTMIVDHWMLPPPLPLIHNLEELTEL